MKPEDAHFRLRLPIELHKQLAEFAEKNDRSINAEIVARLRRSMDWEDEMGEMESNIEKMQAAFEKMQSDIEKLKDHIFPDRYDRD